MKRVDYASTLVYDSSKTKILMVRNQSSKGSYWSIPVGAVEKGETLEQAAIRETKEETGLDVEIHKLYAVREVFFAERGEHALLFTFFADITGGEIHIADPDGEIAEACWLDLHVANEFMYYLPEHLKVKAHGHNEAGIYYFHGEDI